MKILFVIICCALFLCGCGKENTELKEKPKIEIAEDVTITLQAVSFVDSFTQNAITRYEKAYPNVHFEILEPIEWSAKDVGMAKIYSDISHGGGPDLILAGREDLTELVEKGCVLDISDAFFEGTRKVLLKGIVDYGTVDGKMFLAGNNLNISNLIIDSVNIKGDSWNIEEFISTIEQRENEGNPFEWIAVTTGIPCYSVDALDICVACLDSSRFIDWDQRTCSFDDPLFVKLLEISKKYSDYAAVHRPSAKNSNEILELLKNGNVLVVYSQTNSLISYSEQKNILGPDYKWIGFPSDYGSGRIVRCATNLAVNKNTKYDYIIKDFIDSFYSYDICCETNNEVRTDIYDDRIKYDEYTKQYVLETVDSSGRKKDWNVAVKEDGSDYVREYFDYLNTFGAIDMRRNAETEAISDIIYEECELFFSGDKTAEEVTQLIQSRVSLLLSE